MSRTIAIASILLLAGCTPTAPSEAPVAQAGPATLDADSCRRAGGLLKPVGKLRNLRCVLDYADAGRSCRSGSQCAGDCLATPGVDVEPGRKVAGFCQATSDGFGCSTRVENGRARATICID